MAGNRSKFGDHKRSSMPFWANTATNPSSSSSATLSADSDVEEDDMAVEELVASLAKVSVQDTVRAVLTTNDNFADICEQLNSMEVSSYRENTLKVADEVAARVEKDLSLITAVHGAAQSTAEAERRLMIVHVVQAYLRCLELDIEKWKYQLKQAGKSDGEIAAVQITIRDFVPWQQRQSSAPSYAGEKLEKPQGNTMADQIVFVQLALNYWRSCYHYIREYEKLIGATEYAVEMQLWQLEQTTLSYLAASTGNHHDDLNRSRLREPTNVDPNTGQPLSVAAIQGMIQQQQEQSGYKLGHYSS